MALLNLSGFKRVPYLRQSEAAECGLACVGMIAGAHGYISDLPTLRRLFPISIKGTSLKDLADIAGAMGMNSRAIRCEPRDLKRVKCPAILHWDFDHFVVLVKASRNSLTIFDPALGQLKMSYEDVSKRFTGIVMECMPGADFAPKVETNPVKMSNLVKLGASSWGALWQGLVLSIILQFFVLLTPFYIQLVIDEAIIKSDLSLLFIIASAFVLFYVFNAATQMLRGLVFQFLSNTLSLDMESGLFTHLIRLPLSYFHRRQIGDIQQRFQSLTPIRTLIVNGAIEALIDGVLAVLLALVLFMYSFEIGAMVLAFVAFYAGLRFAFLSLLRRMSSNVLAADAKENTHFLESLRAMQTIKATGLEVQREAQWKLLAADTLNAQIKVGNLDISYNAVSAFLVNLSNVVVIYYAATRTISAEMTIGMLTAIMAYKVQLEQRFLALIEKYIEFKLLDVHLDRVSDIALQPRETAAQTPPVDKVFSGEIELNNVGFRYSSLDEHVIRHLSLKVPAGSYIAITAPSGEGKTTLLKLILGLYMPSDGTVLYDGAELGKWGLNNLRPQIGAVLQDDCLLAGTLEQNISAFSDKPDMELVQKSAELAQIHDDIASLPMGYRSLVGDMGSSLSGGQQQRVLLARALYRRPNLLVLDEATSSLDYETERKIAVALRSLSMTRIVAAHRPETLANADIVYKLSSGHLERVIKKDILFSTKQ